MKMYRIIIVLVLYRALNIFTFRRKSCIWVSNKAVVVQAWRKLNNHVSVLSHYIVRCISKHLEHMQNIETMHYYVSNNTGYSFSLVLLDLKEFYYECKPVIKKNKVWFIMQPYLTPASMYVFLVHSTFPHYQMLYYLGYAMKNFVNQYQLQTCYLEFKRYIYSMSMKRKTQS